jgi:hypothetical protein
MPAGAPIAFSVSYDLATELISASIWVVPLVAAFAVARHNATARLILGGSILLISLVAFAYSPREYADSPAEITVRRLIGDVQSALSRLAVPCGERPDAPPVPDGRKQTRAPAREWGWKPGAAGGAKSREEIAPEVGGRGIEGS